jgi:transposase InsO family protein
MGTAVSAELVSEALVMAATRRRPGQRVVHHSDCGAYTALAFSDRLTELGLDQSFGNTGDCCDNAAMGSFFATLKRELAWIHRTEHWPARDRLLNATFVGDAAVWIRQWG